MRQVSTTKTVPSPVGGINAFDSLAAMPEQDAITLRNWYPTSYGNTLRKGYVRHAANFNGTVETLMSWKSNTGVEKLFAIDQSGIYDITVVGDISGPADVALTEPQVQNVSLVNDGGTNLIGFNGTDNGVWYSNSGWQRLLAGDGVATGTWSGVNPADLIQCTVHQKRLWAVEKDSSVGWYLPPSQIFGVAQNFDFGPLFSRGGFLQALATWTRDSGDGPDDYLLAISSAGEVAVYKGTDPNTADTWALVGVYFIGATFTRRCYTKYGGDVIILTQYGIVSMNSIINNPGESILENTISVKIQNLISNLVSEGDTREGWELTTFPPANMLILNVPGVILSQNLQIVLNTIRNSWTIFDNMAAFSWMSTTDSLLFGGSDFVYRAWEGYLDAADYNGENGKEIVTVGQQAFSFFGDIGNLKHFKMVMPTLLTSATFAYNIEVNVDYIFDEASEPDNPRGVNIGIWDQSEWDDTVWAGGANSIADWRSVEGIGYTGSVTMTLKASSEVTWVSTNWMYEIGGPV
jgi:hypothetical protein